MKEPGWIMEYHGVRLIVGNEITTCSESSRWFGGDSVL
jgi:hypothetical protein